MDIFFTNRHQFLDTWSIKCDDFKLARKSLKMQRGIYIILAKMPDWHQIRFFSLETNL